MPEPAAFPDGLSEVQAREDRRLFVRHANPFSVIVLGGLLLAALLGVFAGGRVRPLVAETPQASFQVATPRVVRNGLFFETRIDVAARGAFKDLTIGVSPELWRDMTINTTIPQASEEAFEQGLFRMHYGAIDAGERLVVKIDGQINPPLTLGTHGQIALFDGDRRVAMVSVSIRVLP